MDPLTAALKVSASGLTAQSVRLRVIAENLANARSTGDVPDADPYRRKTVNFTAELDQRLGAFKVGVERIGVDRSRFNTEYDPGNPAADGTGMVKYPNVNMLIEMSDMREANRSYEANLQAVRQTRDMISSTIDLLRSSQ